MDFPFPSAFCTQSTPANWWQTGSYAYPQTDEFLTHIAGTVSYMSSEGNEDNTNLKISGLAILRKGNFTFANSYEKNKWRRKIYENKNFKPRVSSNERYKMESSLMYDLNSYFFTAAGYENGRNLEMAIYNQTIRYAGVGFRALKTMPKHQLNLFVGYGDEDISFELFPILPSGKTNLIYYQLNYSWLMNEIFSLSISYKMADAAMKYRDNSELTLSTNTKISKYISLVVLYNDLHIEALDSVNLFTHDKTISTSLQISF